jgi:hypothetical protein
MLLHAGWLEREKEECVPGIYRGRVEEDRFMIFSFPQHGVS